MKVLSREQFVETIKCSLFRNIIEQQLFSPPDPKTAFAVINQFCFVVVFNVSVVQNAPGRHNCRCRRSHLASPDDDGKLGASSSTFHRQPRLSINQGLCPLSLGVLPLRHRCQRLPCGANIKPKTSLHNACAFPLWLYSQVTWGLHPMSSSNKPGHNNTWNVYSALCWMKSLSSRLVHSKDCQSEHYLQFTAEEVEAQSETMGCLRLRRTRHHAWVSDSAPCSMVWRNSPNANSIRFTLSTLIDSRQGIADPKPKHGTLERERGLLPGPQNLRSTLVTSVDVLGWTSRRDVPWAEPSPPQLSRGWPSPLTLRLWKHPFPSTASFLFRATVSPFPSISPLPFHLLHFYFPSQVLPFSCFPSLSGLLQVTCFSLLFSRLALL